MAHPPALTRWGLVLGLLAVLAWPASAAADGLGTSLSVGIQPDEDGNNQLTNQGYADQLYRLLRPKDRRLQLVKLGCPAETSSSMIDGVDSLCDYPLGSQLKQAVAFLQANPGAVKLLTLDVGSNDLLNCTPGGVIDLACVFAAFGTVAENLPVILGTLRTAAGPDVPIVAMNYYNPFLGLWLQGPEGQALAIQSAVLAAQFNDLLEGFYAFFGVPVADVARAFHSDDFRIVPGIGLPVNVLVICQWTWVCAPPPRGPNVHANRVGYFVIALSFAAALH